MTATETLTASPPDASSPTEPDLIKTFLTLKLRLMANTFKRSPWQLVGIIIGLIYGAGIALFGVIGLVGLRFVPVEASRPGVVLAGAVIIVGFLLVPLAVGVDDTLDPRRFALFGIPTNRLALGLFLAALIGIPSIVITLISAATVVTWSRNFGAVVIGLLAAVLLIATCVLCARVSTAVAASLLATRRAREFTGIIFLLAIVLISPAIAALANVDWERDGAGVVRDISAVVGWTPLGAVWSAPAAAAAGQGGEAVLQILIAAAFAGLLLLAWRALIARMLTTPARAARSKVYSGLGWFDRLPATPTGAIGARSATYWIRDPRYRVSLLMIPITPALMIVPLLVVGVPAHFLALIPLPVMALFLGWAMHNDIAYDNTAVWLHIASGTKGLADRLGRLVPVVAIGIPLVIIGSVVSAALYDDWKVFPALIGVSFSLLFAGAGFSSIMSARFPYPVVQPGDSPFSQPQSSGGTTIAVQSISFAASLALTSPAIIFAVIGFFSGDNDYFVWSLLAGLGVGLLAFAGGVLWGARIFERRGPEILGAALRA